MGAVQPVFFAVVDVEDGGALRSVLCIVLDELQEGRDAHAVVRRAWCSGHRVVVCGEKGAGLVCIVSVDLDEYVRALEVHRVVARAPRAVRDLVVDGLRIVVACRDVLQPSQNEVVYEVVRMRVIGVRARRDLLIARQLPLAVRRR